VAKETELPKNNFPCRPHNTVILTRLWDSSWSPAPMMMAVKLKKETSMGHVQNVKGIT